MSTTKTTTNVHPSLAGLPRTRLSLAIVAALTLLCGCSNIGSKGGGGSEAPGIPTEPPGNPETPVEPTPPAPGEAPTAANVRVGIIDSGLEPGLPTLDYANVHFQSVIGGSSEVNDNVGHGSKVAQALAGTQAGFDIDTGLATGSQLYIAQTSKNNQFAPSNVALAIDWLLDNQARIINMSFSSPESYDDAQILSGVGKTSENESVYRTLEKIADADGLGIIAAGNEAEDNPNGWAQLPLIYNDSSLQDHMITVTGHVENETYTGLHHPALSNLNACGNAAAYCMAASSSLKYLEKDADGSFKPAINPAEGTSFAAPRVAAAAALVQQIFPWMGGHQLQQTLLTTANYQSDAYYDSTGQTLEHPDSANGRPFNDTFGWGYLNVGNALGGPAMFYQEDFTANLGSGTFTFYNNISGDGGLVVSGDGTLRLTGNDSYTGPTLIESGTLRVDGQIASDASVHTLGTLAGTGSIDGSVDNAGTLTTENAGALTINGDYTQQTSGTLNIALNSPLWVNGTATLAGGLKASLPRDEYYVNSNYDEMLLHAGTGVEGQFDTVSTGPFLNNTSISYTDNEVTGRFERVETSSGARAAGIDDAASLATASNVESALQVADDWAQQASPDANQQAFLASAAAFQQLPSAAAAATALQTISGQAHTTSNAILLNSQDAQSQLLLDHLEDTRDAPRQGLWFSAGKRRGSLAGSGYLGADYTIDMAAIGIDGTFGDNRLRAGVAYTYGGSDVDYDGLGGKSEGDLHGVSIYGHYAVTRDWFLQGSLGYQRGEDRLRRTILLNGASAVSSTTRSHAWQGMLKSGYAWQLSTASTLTPYAGLKMSRLETGSFEDRGNNFGLHGKGDDYLRNQALLGFDWRLRQSLGGNWWAQLKLRSEWLHAFANPDLATRASWTGLGQNGQTFEVPGISLDRNSQRFSADLSVGKLGLAHYFVRADYQHAANMHESALRAGISIGL